MSWMNMLYRTYEANAGIERDNQSEVPLTLVSHITANAQLEITIDGEGNFCGAVPIDKDKSKTIIPVTEKSSTRSSGIAPHALCDTLSYVAGDFGGYISDRKKVDERFTAYFSALENWVNSEYTHPKAAAVYKYISKKCMIADLIKAGIVQLGEDGRLSDKKISGKPYDASLVRFRIRGEQPDGTWLDTTLFKSFTSYYGSMMPGKKDICYITGQIETVAGNQPKGIVAANYNAKLISANDTSNFVFRGRFIDSEQASTVGFEAAQKAHSALTWLAANQGVIVGKREFICWNPNGGQVAPIEDALGCADEETPKSCSEAEYRQRLKETLDGYRGKMDDNEDIVVIGLDAATTGRLSVVYYNELKESDFYDRLEYWFGSLMWTFRMSVPPYEKVETPLTRMLVNCAFGTEQSGFLKTDDKVFKEQYQRLLQCMLEKQPIPNDIVHLLTVKATNPQLYEKWYNYENVLSCACAVIAKKNKMGVKNIMKLDYENIDRSYLFGRLLAVLEKAERATYSGEVTREPNAIRLMNAYVNHPLSTWKTIESALIPYYQQLSCGSRAFYKNMVSDITERLYNGDIKALNRPLGEAYLIGYYLQRGELNKSFNANNNKEEK